MGCDKKQELLELFKGISTHAPVWGATRLVRPNRPSPHYFNPRTRVGCDNSDKAAII
ncbi:hypothetical protein [Streptococcus sp. 2018162]|uniref:hypothetical protein n=1 Tax=Streptococcus sp. 2018162 TaxID=2870783 RepID=UPI001C8E9A99|nr:hypothetical protein [Streptococcus sp. 2018162]MBY0730792.1 hypothetical protein [Streptococcus sp. 2018162]